MIEDNCGPLGMPELDPEYPHGPTEFVIREGYVLQHSSEDKIPRWVCEHVTPQEVAANSGVRRRDRFAPDPQLAGKPRAELSDYRRSGFDRGHQAPAGNQNSVQRLKDETFFLSNMTPQTGAHNQQIWADLEHLTRDWVGNGVVDSAFIITGGFFYDPKEEDPATADGMIDYRIIGSGAVAVPTHYFKIVYSQDAAGAVTAVAFVHENRGFPAPFNHAAFIKPIDWIEERAGIDFFPDLDPTEEQRVEGQPGALFE
jgi:DNA/RNA endonuclease G (NUC1)